MEKLTSTEAQATKHCGDLEFTRIIGEPFFDRLTSDAREVYLARIAEKCCAWIADRWEF